MGEINQGGGQHTGGTQLPDRMPRTCDFVKRSPPCWEAERLEAFYSGEKGRLQCISGGMLGIQKHHSEKWGM